MFLCITIRIEIENLLYKFYLANMKDGHLTFLCVDSITHDETTMTDKVLVDGFLLA